MVNQNFLPCKGMEKKIPSMAVLRGLTSSVSSPRLRMFPQSPLAVRNDSHTRVYDPVTCVNSFVDVYAEVMVRCFLFESLSS